jgi:formate dehydrogenase subunit delta
MANQIARNIEAQKVADPAAATAAHIDAFWDRRMKQLVVRHLDAGREDLSPVARAAVEIIALEMTPRDDAAVAEGR